MAAKDSLLHAEFLHLLQNQRCLGYIGPENDGFDAGVLNHRELLSEVLITRLIFLFDDDGMSEAARSIAEFDDAEASVAVVDSQKSDALETELCVDMAGEGVSLNAVVLNVGVIPG